MSLNTALVTGADRGLGLALCKGLLERGWQVFAGQYLPDWPELEALAGKHPGMLNPVALDVSSQESARAAAVQVGKTTHQIDLLINNAGIISNQTNTRTIREGQDYNEIHRVFDVNALGPIRVVEAFLPLVDRSAIKRMCFVSSEAGSIGKAYRTSWYGYTISKAALNMAVKIMFNDLRPQGFTFRMYHPGWVRSYMSGTKNTEAELEPEAAAEPALAYFLSGIGAQTSPVDEDTLILRDYKGQEWPW
jgi:NAD(P)-dependent dehydrogenase (short-subunit alcohol dehydrogenase family)